jgi:predicted dehydrogenase
MRPLTMGVVGLGYWGPNLVRNLFELPDVDVAWICDLDKESLGKLRRRYPSIAGTTRYQDLLDDRELDAVLIATPVSSHFPLAQAALNAGKHAFIEKPLAASSVEGQELIRLAEEKGLVLMPGHTFLYSPPVITIR